MDEIPVRYPKCIWVSFRNRAWGLVILCMLYFLNLSVSLNAGIVLQTSPTEGFIDVRSVEDFSTSLLVVPVCELFVLAKHRGPGYLYLSYTPFTDGIRTLQYQMLDDDNQLLSQMVVFVYNLEGAGTQETSFGRLRARLSTPFEGLQNRYVSNITLHLILEL